MVVYVLAALFLSVFTIWFLIKKRRQDKRRRLLHAPIPDVWVAILERNVSLYRRLPAKLQNQLHGLINLFIHEKRFFGYEGLQITDEIRVTIAAHACILLLNRTTDCYPYLKTILVYPAAYVARETVYDGELQTAVERVRAGESWARGPVVLSWDDAKRGAFDHQDGQNVLLHEFAHQLDQENSASQGAPLLGHPSQYVSWARILGGEYEQLKKKAVAGEVSVIDHYGASAPAEFFAVVSETFFERPKELKRDHPALYGEFRKFYQLDPASWG